MRVLQALFAIQGWALAPVGANTKAFKRARQLEVSLKEDSMKLTIPRWKFPGLDCCFLAGTDEASFVITRSFSDIRAMGY